METDTSFPQMRTDGETDAEKCNDGDTSRVTVQESNARADRVTGTVTKFTVRLWSAVLHAFHNLPQLVLKTTLELGLTDTLTCKEAEEPAPVTQAVSSAAGPGAHVCLSTVPAFTLHTN